VTHPPPAPVQVDHASPLPSIISGLSPLFQSLIKSGTLLPLVILTEAPALEVASESLDLISTADEDSLPPPRLYHYHPAEVLLPVGKITSINQFIDQAIVQFLQLSPLTRLAGLSITIPQADSAHGRRFLVQQQQRLADKLKERLGYLGVYYKRDAKQFLRHLPPQEARELWDTLRLLYRDIVLNYFENSSHLNSLIDEFVNLTFFADIPVTNIVEMHMELMDEFSKQLKMEGRSEDILLDYRLTLIDTIAHLCEMYRRSIPREI
jgi:circadian clock protein KaiA